MKSLHTHRFILVTVLSLIVLAYMLGPNPDTPVYDKQLPVIPAEVPNIENWLSERENQHRLKPDNHARIVWANDTLRARTEYCIVYLHGYSASQEEGNPIHRQIAKYLGANLLLTRLAYHGIDTLDNMRYITVDALWNSAKEALVIGKKLGKKVVLMGTSTGGTLALLLAAQYPNDVHALINMSPNIRLAHPLSFVANNPWGVQLGRILSGGKYQISPDTSAAFKKYWYHSFRLESVAQLQELLETKMNKATYKSVTCPVLNLYYYESETKQDDVVSVEAIKEMHEMLASPVKKIVCMPTVGDHVMGSHIKSKDLESVKKQILNFLSELGIP